MDAQSTSVTYDADSATGEPPVKPPNNQLHPEQWVELYGNYMYQYAMSRLRNATAAEEVVQEAFLAGIRYQHQYAGSGAERAWLLGILKRKIIDFVRKRSKQEKTASYDDSTDVASQLFDEGGRWRKDVPWSNLPEFGIESEELWAIVQDCLKHLPQGQADVFVLSVMEEMDSQEICEALEITPSNLWVRMHRARLGLAKCVGAKWRHEDS